MMQAAAVVGVASHPHPQMQPATQQQQQQQQNPQQMQMPVQMSMQMQIPPQQNQFQQPQQWYPHQHQQQQPTTPLPPMMAANDPAAAAAAMAMAYQQQQQQMPTAFYPPQFQQQQQQQQFPQQQAGPQYPDEIRSLWVGDLQYWMDEAYLSSVFGQTGELVSAKIIRNKYTGQSEGYGFVEFISRASAEKYLQTYNGTQMPNAEQVFRLNWASSSAGERRQEGGSDYSVFVGDLAADVTDQLLLETFQSHGFTSVKGAKVVMDTLTGRTKGYGFVRFGTEAEKLRALTEMNGMLCSTRPMRINEATSKKSNGTQQQFSSRGATGSFTQNSSNDDPNNTTIFVGGLDPNASDEDLRKVFSPYGELLSVKIPYGKGCGFVQFSTRASAEEAMKNLHGTLICQHNIRLSWGRSPASKQQQVQAHPQQFHAQNQWNGTYNGQEYENYHYAPPSQDPAAYPYVGYNGY